MQPPGALDYNFRHVGVIDIHCKRTDHEDAVLGLALGAGCEDVEWPDAD